MARMRHIQIILDDIYQSLTRLRKSICNLESNCLKYQLVIVSIGNAAQAGKEVAPSIPSPNRRSTKVCAIGRFTGSSHSAHSIQAQDLDIIGARSPIF
jgi:hypothetical protein